MNRRMKTLKDYKFFVISNVFNKMFEVFFFKESVSRSVSFIRFKINTSAENIFMNALVKSNNAQFVLNSDLFSEIG